MSDAWWHIRRHIFGNDAKNDAEVVQMYRAVFGTAHGQLVLTHMLTELGFFGTTIGLSETEWAWLDYSRRLLRLCGIWNDDYKVKMLMTAMEATTDKKFNPISYIKRLFRLGLKKGSEGNP